jgi:CubicO group peptidase (beta-lactamase class C family)
MRRYLDTFRIDADLRTADKDRITLRRLLTMSAGFEWDEYIPYTDPNNSETRMFHSSDRWRFALTPRCASRIGLELQRRCTELLGAIVSRATGQPIEQYARALSRDLKAVHCNSAVRCLSFVGFMPRRLVWAREKR